MDKITSRINDFYILKKLGTLGINEFNFRNKALDIQKNDILLVDNPNIVSNAVIELLKDKVFVVVHKNPISRKIESGMPFVFIEDKNLKIYEDKYFGFAEKSDFDSAKNLISKAENESEKINQDLWFLSGAEGIQTIKIGKYLTSAATNFLNIIEGINSIGIGFIDINSDSPKAYPISNRIAKINAEYTSFIENIDLAEKALSPAETSFLPKKYWTFR